MNQFKPGDVVKHIRWGGVFNVCKVYGTGCVLVERSDTGRLVFNPHNLELVAREEYENVLI